mmetsp:Transcript_15086/g.37286  ORF Transcript_15086/g.37286 Transcript_15086/m.37286 type:complete len:351 (-) Transcript_15086:221-1273(-)
MRLALAAENFELAQRIVDGHDVKFSREHFASQYEGFDGKLQAALFDQYCDMMQLAVCHRALRMVQRNVDLETTAFGRHVASHVIAIVGKTAQVAMSEPPPSMRRKRPPTVALFRLYLQGKYRVLTDERGGDRHLTCAAKGMAGCGNGDQGALMYTHHIVACTNVRIGRDAHDEVKDALAHLCRSAGLVVRTEKELAVRARGSGAALRPDLEVELDKSTAFVDVSGTATPSCDGGEFLLDSFIERTEVKVRKYTNAVSRAGMAGVFRAFVFSSGFFRIDDTSDVHSGAFLKELKNAVTKDNPRAKFDLRQFYHDLATASIRLWAISARRFMREAPAFVRRNYAGRPRSDTC